jgi:hypothetical protein
VSPPRENAPCGGVSPITAAKRDQSKCTAALRAEALALDLEAVAAGKWDPTPTVLDALCALAWATVWDLAVAA